MNGSGIMSSAKPLVSIGLPVYNGERRLERAIDSILGQTFTDLELVISDNASTDRTADICRRYAAADGRVKYARNEENLGAAPNYNVVLDRAQGQFFKWASHDDWLEPTYLERCMKVLLAQPEVVAAWPRTKIYDEDEQLLECYVHPVGLTSPQAHERMIEWIWNTKEFAPIFGVFPTSVVLETRRMESYASADRTFFAEVLLKGQVVEIDEYLYCVTRSTSVRKGRDTSWWNAQNAEKPQFDRWRYFWLMNRAIMAAPTLGWLRRWQVAAVNAMFFSRGWPRRSLMKELSEAGRYYMIRTRSLLPGGS